GSMRQCIEETERRRAVQKAYNEAHGITPVSIRKSVQEMMMATRVADAREAPRRGLRIAEAPASHAAGVDLEEWAKILESEMQAAAKAMDFERAAVLRDQLLEVRARLG